IFLDNLASTFGNIENYRKSLWKYNLGPLSFSYKTREPVQYFGDSMAEFVKAFSGYVHSKDLVLMISTTSGSYVWFAPNADLVGGEVPGAEVPSRAFLRRTLGYGKIWTNLYVPGDLTTFPAANVLAYFRQALTFGFHPGFTANYWASSSNYERDRSLFKK